MFQEPVLLSSNTNMLELTNLEQTSPEEEKQFLQTDL